MTLSTDNPKDDSSVQVALRQVQCKVQAKVFLRKKSIAWALYV